MLGLIKHGAPLLEVIAPRERRVEGVTGDRCRRLDSRDRMTWNAVPVTTVARTIVGLAPVLPFDELGQVCHEAWVRHRMRPEEIEAVLARRPRSSAARD